MVGRLDGFFIDCAQDVFEEGVEFWSQAFGVAPERPEDPNDPYVVLPGAGGDVRIEVQCIGQPSRYHLDIAADDVEAEAARLEDLGAVRVEQIEDWWVMKAPTGHVFCVVPTD